jgi:hypothetical protein
MRRFAETLRIALHWEMHGSLRNMAIEKRNQGCPNEIGSFDARNRTALLPLPMSKSSAAS